MCRTMLVLGAILLISSTVPLAHAQGKDSFDQDKRPVIGNLKSTEAAQKIQEVGETVKADEIIRAVRTTNLDARFDALVLPSGLAPYRFTTHAFGYIPKTQANATKPVEIKYAGNIAADQSLKNSQIRVTLDRLRVADYPGDGMHHILFDFYAQHQVNADQREDLHFAQTYRVQEGQQAGIIGYPVFVGLNVGAEGVAFKCYTINVKNDDDEKLLGFMDSDIFKNGLKLIQGVNPILPIVTNFATGITKAIAGRNRNIPVQDFYMGLDFTNVATRARLAEGSYIAVQAPITGWDWSKWVYVPTTGEILSNDDSRQPIPYNYVVFGVSKMQP